MLRLKDLVAASTVLGLLACSGGLEKQLLSRFFMACRSGDNTTVAAVSLVNFPEECVSWDLIEVGVEASQPFRLPGLREEVTEAKNERDTQFVKGKYFLEDNYNSIEKIQLRLDKEPDYEFKGKLGEVQEEWVKIVQDRKTLERNVQELNRELEREAKLAKMSLMRDAPIPKMDGTVLEKDILIKVNTGTEEKPYAISLRRYDLTNTEDNSVRRSRWIIVAITEQAT